MEQSARAKELGLDTPHVGCAACKYNHGDYPGALCDAPQLQEHLEPGVSTTHTQGVRDLKALCGKDARWFIKRGD